MISIEEACTRIDACIEPLEVRNCGLDEALGLILAEPVESSIDSPPFNKALMDGFAVRCADVSSGQARLQILESVMAGQVPTRRLGPGQAIQIMTGAPLPDHCDAVVRIEDTRCDAASETVEIDGPAVRPGQNLMPRGHAMRAGDRIFDPGRRLSAQDLGLLAELGVARPRVFPAPRVAVLATGDELVDAAESPGPGQIRNSNQPLICAQVRRAGGIPVPLGIARDNRADLTRLIAQGLSADVLLLSGGVSAGVLDLVPSVLVELGVREVFHKVRMKPGKPVWFGTHQRPDQRSVVFGLPGNPVSSLVCFELFVRQAMRRLAGLTRTLPERIIARLSEDHIARGDRPTYYPACLYRADDVWMVRPCAWKGSADLRSTVTGNSMIEFPAGDRQYSPGMPVSVIPWEPWPGDSTE